MRSRVSVYTSQMPTLEATGSPQKQGLLRIHVFEKILLYILILPAAISLWGGLRNALVPDRSQDFQWSGTRMVLQHVDPWQDYLTGDPAHAISRVQVPNYIPLMYVLLVPLGLMSIGHATMVWALLNILFGLVSGILCGRFYGLDKTMCGVLVTLLAMSTPMRNTVGNGQQGLLVLFFWVLALCHAPRVLDGFTIGLSYCKYSFAPPVFLFLLLRMGYRAALRSLVPAIGALVIVHLWLGGSLVHPAGLVHMLFAPLKVASQGGYFGGPGPNLMDTLEWALEGTRVSAPMAKLIVYAVPMAVATALLLLFARRKTGVAWDLQIALLALVSLALFKHHPYDGVVLLLPMAYCLTNLRQVAARWGAALICCPWYGDRLLRGIGIQPYWSFVMDLVILAVIGAIVSRVRSSSAAALDEQVLSTEV